MKFLYIYVGFHSCVDEWCFQKGTNQQYTRCKTVSKDGRTCYNPTIRYGSTIGGTPAKHQNNNILQWIQQLFPTAIICTATYNIEKKSGHGALWWCQNYEEYVWHWCDWADGNWKDSGLGFYKSHYYVMDSVTCQIP